MTHLVEGEHRLGMNVAGISPFLHVDRPLYDVDRLDTAEGLTV
jgi:hypothetical protein